MPRLLRKTLSTDRHLLHGVDGGKTLLSKEAMKEESPLSCTFLGALANSLCSAISVNNYYLMFKGGVHLVENEVGLLDSVQFCPFLYCLILVICNLCQHCPSL